MEHLLLERKFLQIPPSAQNWNIFGVIFLDFIYKESLEEWFRRRMSNQTRLSLSAQKFPPALTEALKIVELWKLEEAELSVMDSTEAFLLALFPHLNCKLTLSLFNFFLQMLLTENEWFLVLYCPLFPNNVEREGGKLQVVYARTGKSYHRPRTPIGISN